jgi:hypothetical protein
MKYSNSAETSHEADIHEHFVKGFNGPSFALLKYAEDPYLSEIPDNNHLLAGFWCEGKYYSLSRAPGTSNYSGKWV